MTRPEVSFGLAQLDLRVRLYMNLSYVAYELLSEFLGQIYEVVVRSSDGVGVRRGGVLPNLRLTCSQLIQLVVLWNYRSELVHKELRTER